MVPAFGLGLAGLVCGPGLRGAVGLWSGDLSVGSIWHGDPHGDQGKRDKGQAGLPLLANKRMAAVPRTKSNPVAVGAAGPGGG